MLILLTGLYDDQQRLKDVCSTALDTSGEDTVEFQSIEPNAMNPADWDDLVERIMVTERVITL